MVPDPDAARRIAEITELELRLLTAPEAPIVLVERKAGGIAPSVAPGNPYLGIMVPSTPLHHLLLRDLGSPVVATSGNLSDEPLCIDEDEALDRLGGIADVFLIHDRPIHRHVDDSIVRVMAGRAMVLRRARGYAPIPVTVRGNLPEVIAVGAHLKNTVAVAKGRDVFISQHLGDLETEASLRAFRREVEEFRKLFNVSPARVVSDSHPDYLSSKEAAATGLPRLAVQHHYAHVRACMADNELDGHVLGVSWDGTGLGTDGSVWGGEFLLTTADGFRRVASFRLFPLPGGDAAVKEPRRSALGLLYAMLGDQVFDRNDLLPVRVFSAGELRVIRQMLAKNVHCPPTSSVGRLFDAVASLTGVRHRCSFEGQAAMELEFAARDAHDRGEYRWDPDATGLRIDWEPMARDIIADLASGVPAPVVAARFHNTLAGMIAAVAVRTGERRVALTGGCFQNRILCETAIRRLKEAGFSVYWHQRVPPNDGGISLGQALAARDSVT
jgi:hydrogenase maturation protein HypF